MAEFNDIPHPPFINIDGLPNFRDIGGYPIASAPGKTVKRGIVFRSSEPSKVTDQGVAKLQELKITDVYDLRSRQEMEKDARDGQGRQAKEWDGAKRIFAPVFLDVDYSPEALALRFKNYANDSTEGFVEAYQDILNSATSATNVAQPYRSILQHIASSNPTPLLLHCTAGKDRTGVICAMILSLCGVQDEVVAHEYSLTDLGLRNRHSEFLKHLLNEPALRDNPAGARRMIGSRKQNMLGTLEKIRQDWGSVEKYVLSTGLLSEDDLKQLRQNLIVDAADDDIIDWQSHAKLVEIAESEGDKLASSIHAAQSQT